MDKYTQGRRRSQVCRLRNCRQQIAEDQDLCFTKLLPKEQVEAALQRHQVRFRKRLYTPLVTIWTFLYQVLASDQSCRAAVARLLAFLCVGGDDSGSAKTDPYCKARQRLPEKLLPDLARNSGCDLHRQVPPTGLLHLHLVTTFLDAQLYSKDDLARAFRCRWHAELDLRSIKQVMQMDVLRCKSPAMVRKEIWMHLLAYNLIRKLMAQAAAVSDLCPRDISFKGTLQTLVVFAIAGWSCPEKRHNLYVAVLRAVATHRVNDRPDRIEPRAVKRRPKKLIYLNEPRSIAKARLLNGTQALWKCHSYLTLLASLVTHAEPVLLFLDIAIPFGRGAA